MWASVIPFFTTFYLCKASLLVIYLQLFPPFMRKRRFVVWSVVVYCIVAYIASICLQLFSCYPIRRNWFVSYVHLVLCISNHVSGQLLDLRQPARVLCWRGLSRLLGPCTFLEVFSVSSITSLNSHGTYLHLSLCPAIPCSPQAQHAHACQDQCLLCLPPGAC